MNHLAWKYRNDPLSLMSVEDTRVFVAPKANEVKVVLKSAHVKYLRAFMNNSVKIQMEWVHIFIKIEQKKSQKRKHAACSYN